MKLVRVVALAAGLTAGAVVGPVLGETRVVDRVVAVIDDVPIFASSLRERAAPRQKRLEASVEDPVQLETARAGMIRDLLDQMIDEALMERAAAKENIVVASDELDAAMKQVAAQNKWTVAQLLTQLESDGFSEALYRVELRATLLEQKLVRLRLSRQQTQRTSEMSPEDYARQATLARGAMLAELRETTFVEVRL
ncbi:SurA N-terminal domain-containing protein [Chondromyces apiculatus]|uniref:Survival protein SurA (Peptidyl-prolyl cis-trans isomerase SurA) n=1 Tax=Chondromyces apiculatus DSM 436 TaxID=1192034 RepID=A0A017TGK6_9BACT|nr:SurA N-terminal domain-containing protein [Chondromyces apiculatus]EYF07950.1 Survival protein SurA precursor (Peptidyl-prolyl cis-trans isomerase SurA) [Chondromyces apiculatus DSM 436]